MDKFVKKLIVKSITIVKSNIKLHKVKSKYKIQWKLHSFAMVIIPV